MKNILKTLENVFSGEAMAEAGEFDAALILAGMEARPGALRETVERDFAAVAFAEANCADEALAMRSESGKKVRALTLGGQPGNLADFLKDVGLAHAPVRLVLAAA